MTRKDYVAIARALRNVPSIDAYATWAGCVEAIADVCQSDNPRFQRGKFREACGIVRCDDTTETVLPYVPLVAIMHTA